MAGRYQAYSEYKDTGANNLGNIPSHWHITKVKFISRCLDGSRIPLNAEQRGSMQGSIPYWGANSIVDYVDNHLFDEELVLLGEDGAPFFEHTKDVAFNVSGKIWPNNHVHVLRPDLKKISSKFLKYALNCVEYHLYITGSTRDKLNQSDMNEIFVRSCSVDEQEQIANFLDHETAKIDTLIDKQQQLIKLLKEKRQAVISHAVTKGLNPDAVMKDSGVEWLGEVPEHWDVCKLKHIINALESGVSVNAADTPAQENERGVLKTSCVYTRSFRSEENKTVFKEEEGRLKCPVRKGAIIISRMNTPDLVGASALVEDDSPNLYLPDRLWQTDFANNDRQNPKYVAFFMMLQGFRNQISLAAEGASSSMQNIAKGDYLSINIVLPEINEQNSIVSYVESKLQTFGILEGQADKAIKLLQERRTALISAAVTGKIDVRNWQPTQAENPREASA